MQQFKAALSAALLATMLGLAAGAVPARAQDGTAQCPGNPDAIGTSRVIAIDSDQLKRIGRMQYPDSLPLADKEVVLTFDDGPLPPYSNQILDILAAQCVKATYFMVGTMAHAYPQVVRRVYEAGHTIGTHSEHHPSHFSRLPPDRLREEIDGGIADVGAALGDPKYLAPFFRFPGLDRSDTAEGELAARSLIAFSSDTVADDWHRRITAKEIVALALKRLEARGKGILLLHDIHPVTVAALPGLLNALKDNGFHIVQVVPSPSYLIAMAARPQTGMLASTRPEQLDLDAGALPPLPPTWPPAPHPADNLTPDDIALPVPDAADFQPDSGVAEGDVQWPAQAVAPPDAGKAAPAARPENPVRHARSAVHERLRLDRPHGQLHRHAGADNQPASVMSRVKTFAALFAPAQQGQ